MAVPRAPQRCQPGSKIPLVSSLSSSASKGKGSKREFDSIRKLKVNVLWPLRNLVGGEVQTLEAWATLHHGPHVLSSHMPAPLCSSVISALGGLLSRPRSFFSGWYMESCAESVLCGLACHLLISEWLRKIVAFPGCLCLSGTLPELLHCRLPLQFLLGWFAEIMIHLWFTIPWTAVMVLALNR